MLKIPTGIFGLDELISGGFVKNTVNAVLGTVGCGKTIFSLQYLLQGIEDNQEAVYISFDLEVKDFLRIARSMGWKLEEKISDGLLKVGRFQVEDSFIDSELVKFITGKDMRIVIDSFTPLVASLESSRARNEVNWLYKTLRESGTALITVEEPFFGTAGKEVDVPLILADCVIQLKNVGYGEAYSRTLRVIKHRMSPHLNSVFPYSILEGVGLVVEEKRCEGFEVDLSDLPLSESTKEKLYRYCKDGILKPEEIQKIRRRLI
ncbi:MAG: ATPase domain-containing protein [Archaeoglobaceae archaeon]